MPGRARREHQAAILAEALRRVAASAPAGVCLLDLDSTLLDNRPRQARILRDYGAGAGLPELLDVRAEDLDGWNLEAALRGAGLHDRDVATHLEPARRFWEEWFFTSAYCRLDVPVPGAPAFVRDVVAAGGRIAYVTGRPRNMEDGTLTAFRRAGLPFPDGDRVTLLMKDRADLGDDAWKREACARIAALGSVVAAFDNEPAHVNAYAEAFPDAFAVHVDTGDTGRAVDVLARVPSIADFTR